MKESNNALNSAIKKKVSTAVALCLGGALLGAAPGTFAQANDFKLLGELSAGVACEFPLRIESRGEGNFYKEFRDEQGNLVRVMSAASKVDYRFTNLSNNAQYVVNGRGSMSKTEFASNGSRTDSVQGHSIVIFYPTDIPPGPSMTEYVGRVVYVTDANGVSVLKQTSGQKSDLCAKLSSAD